MKPIKRVLCLHDLSGVGRCSLSVIAPVLSAMGVQACMLPTALLSTHTSGFGAVVMQDNSAFVSKALEHYKNLELPFDAVYSGYLSSLSQAQLAIDAFVANPQALKVADPVLADHGRLYAGMDEALCDAMRAVCLEVDVITPNVTESAILLGDPPNDDTMTGEQITKRIKALFIAYPNVHFIVITGVHLKTGICGNACMWPGGEMQFLPYNAVKQNYPGTGDLFTAVLTGDLLLHSSGMRGVRRAANFVESCAAYTFAQQLEPRFGVVFEPLLRELIPYKPES